MAAGPPWPRPRCGRWLRRWHPRPEATADPQEAESSTGPLDNYHAGTVADLGCQLEFIDEPSRPGQAEPHSVARGPAVCQRQVKVGDARPFVAEADPDAALAVTRPDHLDPGQAAAAVHQGIAGQFAGRGHHLGLVHQGEAAFRGQDPYSLPNTHHVVSRLDRQFIHQVRPFSISRPLSAFRAVRTPRRDRPSSVSVMATAGRIPTMTVSASNNRDMDPIMVSIRPMKESTISTEVMSMITPRAPALASSSARSSCRRSTLSSCRSIWMETKSTPPILTIGTRSIRRDRPSARRGSVRALAHRPALPWWRCRRTRCRAPRSSARPGA